MKEKKLQNQDGDQEAIIALCTPRGSGAIALLRVCGADTISIVNQIAKLSDNTVLNAVKTHTIHHGYIIDRIDKHNIIDEVLFFVMHAPKTFTGQDTVEISCHNNPFIIEKIIELSIRYGARLAQPGEFTKRAYLNKKIDLVQAESINDLINAQTQLALKKTLSQLRGSLSYFLHDIETDLVNVLSMVEGSFEFLEEEQKDLDLEVSIKQRIDVLSKKLQEMQENFNQQQQIKHGIKICILGDVNVGKSTLFNALVKDERAIVTKVEGTTRDTIEYSMYKQGNFWSFIDTAGLRHTQDFIEKQGIERALVQAKIADIILLVFDCSKLLQEEKRRVYQDIFTQYKDKVILVANKVDLEDPEFFSTLCIDETRFVKVSGLHKTGIEQLEKEIEDYIQVLFSKLDSPFLLNQRQYNLVLQMKQKLDFVENNCMNPLQYELIAYHIKQMLEMLCELTGKNVTEKILDSVFSTFCIGK
jgi:tRNA modification GTPase